MESTIIQKILIKQKNLWQHGLNKSCRNLKNKKMEKYIVNIHISKFDKKGIVTSEEHDYEFSSGNLVKDRKKAIKKAKKLIANIDDFLPEGEVFSSPYEAELKGYRNFNCFILTLNLVNEEGDCYLLFGEGIEERLDGLQYEAQVFRRNSLDVDYTTLEIEDGEFIEVLEDDLYFILI